MWQWSFVTQSEILCVRARRRVLRLMQVQGVTRVVTLFKKNKTFQVSFDHCPFGNVDNLRLTREAASTPLLRAHVVAGQA